MNENPAIGPRTISVPRRQALHWVVTVKRCIALSSHAAGLHCARADGRCMHGPCMPAADRQPAPPHRRRPACRPRFLQRSALAGPCTACRVGSILMQGVPRYVPTELHTIADQEVGGVGTLVIV